MQKQFVMDLQQSMLEQLKREARVEYVARLRKDAREELIDERLQASGSQEGSASRSAMTR